MRRWGWCCARKGAGDTQALRSAALGLVFVSAACCVYYYLLPNGNVSRTAGRLLSVFFLLCALSPLFSLFEAPGFFAPAAEQGAAQPQADCRPAAAAWEAALGAAADAVIRARTDVPYEIGFSVHITEDGGIDIERVTVTFEREFAGREALAAALREALGNAVETEVRNAAAEKTDGAGAAAAAG